MCVTSPVVVAGTALQSVDRDTGTEKEKKVGVAKSAVGKWRDAHLPLLKCLTTMVRQSQALCRPIAQLI